MKTTNVLMVLIALFVGVFMENLDHTIMATAMPSVVGQLGGMEVFSWVFSVYLLTSTIFIPIFGKLADQYGKKPFLMIGFITFIAASALSANAESIGQLIAYRALQGLGAAPLMPIAFSMIFSLIKQEKQGHIQGLLAGVSGLSLILGPMIGAYLTENYAWQWIFWINIPLGIVAAGLIGVFYKEKRDRKKASVDYAGALMLAFAIAPLIIGLTIGGKNYAWGSWQILALFGLCAIFTYLFFRIERKAQEPIIRLHLFNKKVVASTGVGFFQGFVMIALMIYIPFYIQGVQGGTVTHVGTILTHMIVALIVGTGIGGHLLAKVPPRNLIFSSLIFMVVGGYMLTQISTNTTDMYFYIAMVCMGLGMGPLFPITTLLAQTSVPAEHTTSVTAILSFFRNIGMAVGSSMLAAIVNFQLMKAVQHISTSSDNLSADQTELLKDPNLLVDTKLQHLIPSGALHSLQNALSSGIVKVFMMTIVVVIIMFLFSFLAGKARLTASHDGKKIGFH